MKHFAVINIEKAAIRKTGTVTDNMVAAQATRPSEVSVEITGFYLSKRLYLDGDALRVVGTEEQVGTIAGAKANG